MSRRKIHFLVSIPKMRHSNSVETLCKRPPRNWERNTTIIRRRVTCAECIKLLQEHAERERIAST